MAELALATWNIAAERQAGRAGPIAEHLAAQGPGITVITELTAASAFRKALTREVGPQHSLSVLPTGSPYEDALGIVITDPESGFVEDPESVDTGGKKMPHFMRAVLRTPLGEMSMVAMRAAYVTGRGGRFTTGKAERIAQYMRAIDVTQDGDISIVAGDMNSRAPDRDPLFAQAGYGRLSEDLDTWPDPVGMRLANWDAKILAKPFLWLGKSAAIDAIYGKGPIEGGETEAVATGLSDHLYLSTTVRTTDPAPI